MGGDIAVRITLDAGAIPWKARQPQGAIRFRIGEPVGVEPLSDAHIQAAHFRLDFLPSASRRASVSCAASSGASV